MRTEMKYLITWAFLFGMAVAVQDARSETPSAATGETDILELGQPMTEEGLGRQDGRQDIEIDQVSMQMTEMQSSATMSGNNLSALDSSITTGLNSIAGGAFTNANGIVTVIQNSGNQVLIQNDMILNLLIK